MSARRWRRLAVAAILALWMGRAAMGAEPRPNIVLIFCDNLGHGDLGCTGSTVHRTPHLDGVAREGARLTSFYVASGVCTASRAALMTGCYPRRVNMHVSDRNTAVLQPVSAKGLHPDEMTIAEVLKPAGYATACIGKWHLGDQREFLPTRQGFDVFYGIPYSDDMTKEKKPELWPELPLLDGEQVIEAPADRDTLVKRCTERAIAFMEENRARPFFLYLPHTMPGSTDHPFSSAAFHGRSRNGSYGDAVEELDWSAGEILAALARLGLAEKTLFIFSSDNGAILRPGPGGSNAPYRGTAYDTSEGSMRMPCVMRWPGRIAPGRVVDAVCTTMDLLPTFAKLAGAGLPPRKIDGHDVGALLFGKGTATDSPWDVEGFCYYRMDQLQAVRSGPWKLYLPLEAKMVTLGRKTAPAAAELYDVRNDVGETREVSAGHPEVVARLLELAERARGELGDGKREGAGQRPAGQVEVPRALVR